METNFKPRLTACLLAGAISSFASTAATAQTQDHTTGRVLFDQETFGGDGRTCVTCHSKKTGTFSIGEAQARFVQNPNEALFRAPDSDNGDGQTYSRLLTTGTVKIDVPLAPNVRLVDDPSARTVSVFRATPTVKNVTTLQTFLMADGREASSNLQHQALSAVHQHTQNTVEPTAAQLNQIAEFERTDERFFSSDVLQRFASGGPPPKLPRGTTASERRGREFFRPDRQCGVCHSGPMLDTSSEFDFLAGPGSRFHSPGAGFQLGPLADAFDADGNLILEPTNPNVRRTFEFTQADGSKIIYTDTDPGRALITGNLADAAMFKIPTLWGVKNTAPYFHDNSSRTLEEVMDHYNRLFQFINDQLPGGVPNGFLFQLLTDQDQADVIAFLKLL